MLVLSTETFVNTFSLLGKGQYLPKPRQREDYYSSTHTLLVSRSSSILLQCHADDPQRQLTRIAFSDFPIEGSPCIARPVTVLGLPRSTCKSPALVLELHQDESLYSRALCAMTLLGWFVIWESSTAPPSIPREERQPGILLEVRLIMTASRTQVTK